MTMDEERSALLAVVAGMLDTGSVSLTKKHLLDALAHCGIVIVDAWPQTATMMNASISSENIRIFWFDEMGSTPLDIREQSKKFFGT